MLTPRGIKVYNSVNEIPYDGGYEPVKEIVEPERFKVEKVIDRRDLIMKEKEELYKKNLKLKAPSVGSVPEGKESPASEKIDSELERLFGEMGTGKGYGIRALSDGIPTFDETL